MESTYMAKLQSKQKQLDDYSNRSVQRLYFCKLPVSRTLKDYDMACQLLA